MDTTTDNMTEKKYILLRNDVLSTIDASSTLPVQSSAINTALAGKLNANMGATYSGKFLKIDSTGAVVPGEAITGVAFADISGSPSDNAALDAALEAKVDVVEGKQLSTEDFTTALKSKLEGIDAGAEVNVIETVKVDGVAQTVTGKAINISLEGKVDKETGKSLMSSEEHTKLAGIEDGAQENVNANWTATSGDAQILNKPFTTIGSGLSVDNGVLSADVQLHFQVVSALPETGETNIIYLVPKTPSETGNVYDEFIWVTTPTAHFERIGSTEFVLNITQAAAGITINNTALQAATDSQTGLLTAADHAAFAGKQDALTFDDAPTSGSANPVKSGGVYTAVEGKLTRSAGSFTIGYDSNGYYLEQ